MPFRFKRHHVLIGVLLALGAAALCGLLFLRRSPVAIADLWFFDVGQGDAALIRDASGTDILIDGGPDDAVLAGLASALPWNDRHLDIVIVTHLDTDHYAGLFSVLRRYEVGELWWTGAAAQTDTARRFIAMVDDLGIPQRFVKAGDGRALSGDARLDVLFPLENLQGALLGKSGGGLNDASVVARLSCGAERALYTGDLGERGESKLIAAGSSLEADLLKIGHHGSAHSSTTDFLDAVHPEDAVVSSGAGNRYGHPAPRVIADLLERGIRIHRTDREGALRFVCDAQGLRRAARPWWKP